MRPIVPVAYDFSCPWCWIGWNQAKLLRIEFGIEFDWLPYELYPSGLSFPEMASQRVSSRIPPTPSRIALAYAAANLTPPVPTPNEYIRTHFALAMAEAAAEYGAKEAMMDRVFSAMWREGRSIDDPAVIMELAEGLIPDTESVATRVLAREFDHRIVRFDDEANEAGVFHVPTFWIEGTRYAEQPLSVLRGALAAAFLNREVTELETVYDALIWPDAPRDRPYTVINMATTIDGKILTGERDEPVMDLGSSLDHRTMRFLESQVDAVLIGAGTLRATPKLWYEKRLLRIVVSESGRVDFGNRFFTDSPGLAVLVCRDPSAIAAPAGVRVWPLAADFAKLWQRIRSELGVRSLLVEGGSEINARVIQEDLADELFLTLTPKVKLGRNVPTYAGGDPLPRERIRQFELVQSKRAGNEMFLRYRHATQ